MLARARRRLNALPSVLGSRVTYEPGEDDRAKVTAAVFERPLVPTGVLPVVASGLQAIVERSIGIAVASPTGGGELWTGSWRWWERRPRLAIGLAAPAPFGGVWSLEAFAERQTYGLPEAEISERRRGVVLKTSDWISGTTRIEAGAAIDRWTADSTGTLLGGVERVFMEARASAAVDAGLVVGSGRTALVNLNGEWRSTTARAGSAWNARAGFSAAGAGAPLALWPGAGAGQGRDALLRAHPLLEDGVIRGVFGRRLAHGSVEWRHWTGPLFKSLHVAPAIFVDVARAYGVPAYGDARAHVDAGAGVRVAIPGGGVLRADLARGLRDGRTALSFGWTR